MRAIQFVSLFGQDEVDVPDLGLRFRDREIKSVTDEQAAVLLGNPNFQEAAQAAKVSRFQPSSPAENRE